MSANSSDTLSTLRSLRERNNKMPNLKSASRRSVSVLNLDSSDKNLDETLFNVLMNDPIKRPIILQMLEQERENIKTYKEIKDKEERAKQKQLKKTQKLMHCESPTALLRRRVLTRTDSESDSSSNAPQSSRSDSPKIEFDRLLEGVCAYIEIQYKGENRSAGARATAEAMGATVSDTLTKKVTHVIFKDGSFTTYQKAKLLKIHLVSILWLKAVETTQSRVPEKNFPALGTELYDANITQICQEYEEAVQDEYKRLSMLPHKSNNKTHLPFESRSQCLVTDCVPIEYQNGRRSRISESVIPSSQSWEAESIISYPGGTLPSKRTHFTSSEQETTPHPVASSPELTSDDDSDCGVVDGHSMKLGQIAVYNPSLGENNQEKSSIDSSKASTSSHCSPSLLYKKRRTSTILKHDNLNAVDMDLTTTAVTTNNIQTREIANKRKSLRIEKSNLQSNSKLSNKRHTCSSIDIAPKKRKISTKESENELVTRNSSLASKETPEKELTTLNNGSKNVSSEDVPAVIIVSDNNSKDLLKSESIGSLRLSENSNNTSMKNPSNNNLQMDNSKITILDDIRLDPNHTEKNVTVRKRLRSSRRESISSLRFSHDSNNSKKGSVRNRRESISSLRISHDSSNSKRSSIGATNLSIQSVSDKNKTSSTSSEDLPSLRISANNSETVDSEKSPFKNVEHDSLEKNGSGSSNKTETKTKVYRKLYNLNDPVEIATNEVVEPVRVENVNESITVPNNNNEVSQKNPYVPLERLILTQNAINVLKKAINKSNTKTKMSKVNKNTEKTKQIKNVKSSQVNSGTSKVKILKTPVKKIVTPRRPTVTTNPVARRSIRLQSLHGSKTPDTFPITPHLNRRSSLDFVQSSLPKSPNIFTQKAKRRNSTIVCTRMHRPEVQTFIQIVKKLKGFVIENEVSKKTTHLVVGDCKRTINLLRAITYGCWIVSKEWLFRSLEAGKWLDEEDFELTDFSVAVQQCRMQRHAFGSLYKMDVFSNCGSIYVSRNTIPRASDLEELIELGGGTLTQSARNANVVVGTWVRYENVKCVRENWVLDCITFNRRKSFKNYLISN